ncbi:MAG: efflux RND transporter periplasmic adaptor subunit [Terriglobales bacterium]
MKAQKLGVWNMVGCVAAVAAALAGCGQKAAAPAGAAAGRGAMPAMPVQVQVAEPVPVPTTSTFVSSIQSRQSTVVMPLVAGILRAIDVHSGEQVTAGQPLMQIDDALQQATVNNLVASRAALTATLKFDQTQLGRAQQLYQEKIGTQQDYEQAQSTYQTAKAQADSLDAQIQQAQTSLSYYQVTAPRAGVIGDIPVKVGDLVTTATELTTLDSGQGLEVYIPVPLEDAGKLRPGLPVAVLDSQGHLLAQCTIYFVSPQVDNQTQTILAKAALPPSAGESLRTQQYVQARVTWGTHSGYLVPLLAVVQQGDAGYLDIAAPTPAPRQGYMVQQVPVTLGQIQGNSYEVTAGLQPGERVIVSTHQILAPGMPVTPMAAPPGGARGGAAPGGGRG